MAAPPPGVDALGPAVLALARNAVEGYVRAGRIVEPAPALPPELRQPGGVFVSLRAVGRLRGCVGTVAPSRPDLAREIVASAVAATCDPRFPPVRAVELPLLAYAVHLIEGLEPVKDPEALDPGRYGVLVEAAGRRGVLLPRLAGVESVAAQLRIARAKAGLGPDAAVRLYRFEARCYEARAAGEAAGG